MIKNVIIWIDPNDFYKEMYDEGDDDINKHYTMVLKKMLRQLGMHPKNIKVEVDIFGWQGTMSSNMMFTCSY
jgi:hypothetical protein